MNTPAEIAKAYLSTGKRKVQTVPSVTLILAFLAGGFIAVGGITAATASAGIGAPGPARLVSGAVFPSGLAMVLIAGAELFTGNSLLILPFLEGEITLPGMLKNWILVYIGNLAGSICFAWLVVFSGLPGSFGGLVGYQIANAAAAKCALSFPTAFLRGVGCNFLVCIAVWMSFAAKDIAGKIAGMYFPICAFVIIGFEHSIANMYYISAGLFVRGNAAAIAAVENAVKNSAGTAAPLPALDLSGITWGSFLAGNLLPVTLGNIVGGAVFVGAAYWFCYLRERK